MKNFHLSQSKLQLDVPNREQNILYLQDRFLINDFHHFKVENILDGRKIISTMLNSLNYYQNIACLTTFNNCNLQKNIFDVYIELSKEKYLENVDNLIEFFLETFDFDFIWIEESNNILQTKWYKIFKQHLVDFNFHKIMPIIVIS